ncbi:MAG TPA: cupredoxin domain-containing protein [Thermoanaerobaculia bacterium]
MTTTTKSTAKTAVGRLVLTAALAAMPILTACGAAEKASAKGTQTVEVHLSEGTIQMPATVPSGKTKFQVINDGTSVHGFQIEGPSGDKQVPTVAPGQKASLEMILDPGTYRILSPVDAGKTQGMEKALNVS